MTPLDDMEIRRRLDPDGTYERIFGLPEQCAEAWQQSKGVELPGAFGDVERVLVLGMGGSAIAADFLQALAFDTSPMPVTVVRGYGLPQWVDDRTLIIACSHSGNTEEVLSGFEQAMQSKAQKLVITTGGRLREIAESSGVPCLTYEYPNVPRDAFGHGLVRLLSVARALGLLKMDDGRMGAAIDEMKRQRQGLSWEVPADSNRAKQVAQGLADLFPLTVGAGIMAPVARRWRTQINENADAIAFWDELPELNHNLVVGLRHPADLLRSVRAVFLDHESIHERTRLRIGLTIELFEKAGITCERLTFPSGDKLAAQLSAVHFGDLVSYYLAILKGTRPMEIDNINWLKDQLAAR